MTPRSRSKHSVDILPASSETRLSHWWNWGCLLTAGILTAAGPFLLRFAFEDTSGGPAGILLASGGSIALLLGIGLGVWNQIKSKRHARDNEARRAAGATRLNDSLAAMHRALGSFIMSDQTLKDARVFFSHFVTIAPRMAPFEGARVCVYQYDTSDDPEVGDTEGAQANGSPSGPREQLERIDYGGRGDEPREFFYDHTDYGAKLINVAKDKSAFIVDDARYTEFTIDRPSGRSWVSFIAIPLRYSKTPRGVITIDSREPQRFTSEDAAIGWSIANIAALGMTVIEFASKNTRPETDELLEALRRVDDQDSHNQKHTDQ